MRQEQANGERAIFERFAVACGLPIRLSSIESRPTPEPDIRCVVDGEGPLAFELGEVINEALEQATNEDAAIRRSFRTAYASLAPQDRERIEECLGGLPAVFVSFPRGTSPGKWRRAVPPIIAALVARSHMLERGERLAIGEMPVWLIPELRDVLIEMIVERSNSDRPFLGELGMTPVVDRTRRLLQQKFSKTYRTDAPLELLTYFIGQFPPNEPEWKAETLDFIRARCPQSPFRRVWLFDGVKRRVFLVHPDPLS